MSCGQLSTNNMKNISPSHGLALRSLLLGSYANIRRHLLVFLGSLDQVNQSFRWQELSFL